MSDTIFVTGVLIHAHHGVMEHEGKVGQRFVIDLELTVDLASASRSDKLADTGILINLGCPGYCATDLNGFRGHRTPEQGAAIGIQLATLPDDGPTGGFFDDDGVIPW